MLKSNFAKKLWMKLLLAGGIGGIIGGMVGILGDRFTKATSFNLVALLHSLIFPSIIVLTVFSVSTCLILEYFLRKMKQLFYLFDESDDEKIDWLENQFERYHIYGELLNFLVIIACLLILALIICFANTNHLVFSVVIIFIELLAISWTNRLYRLLAQVFPSKAGVDYTKQNAMDQWLAHSDEGEKQLYYQSSYYTFSRMNLVYAFILLILLVSLNFSDKGLVAMFMVSGLTIAEKVLFYRQYLKLRKQKIS